MRLRWLGCELDKEGEDQRKANRDRSEGRKGKDTKLKRLRLGLNLNERRGVEKKRRWKVKDKRQLSTLFGLKKKREGERWEQRPAKRGKGASKGREETEAHPRPLPFPFLPAASDPRPRWLARPIGVHKKNPVPPRGGEGAASTVRTPQSERVSEWIKKGTVRRTFWPIISLRPSLSSAVMRSFL